MKFIPRYISCANGYSEAEYLFPELKQILEPTHGIMVYQEQIMAIATELAGFSGGQSDNFRRGVGRKDEELIEEQIQLLIYGSEEEKIDGLIKRGIPLESALELGKDIISFSAYAFNKSHSAGYAVLTIQTGYLKTHYPLEYMTALISSNIQGDDTKITRYVEESRNMGLTLLPPDVNKSEYEFSIEDGKIRFGLGGIKGVNKAGIALIIERNENGPFTDVDEFLDRFSKKLVNKTALNSLTLSGAFESIFPVENRLDALKEIYEKRGYPYTDEVLDKYSKDMDSSVTGAKQIYNEAVSEDFIKNIRILQLEEMLLGTYISGHPLTGIAEPINWEQENVRDNVFETTGIITKCYVHKTTKGDEMAFIAIDTLEGSKDIVVFPRDYAANINKLDLGGIRTFTVKVNMKLGETIEYSYICRNVKYYRG